MSRAWGSRRAPGARPCAEPGGHGVARAARVPWAWVPGPTPTPKALVSREVTMLFGGTLHPGAPRAAMPCFLHKHERGLQGGQGSSENKQGLNHPYLFPHARTPPPPPSYRPRLYELQFSVGFEEMSGPAGWRSPWECWSPGQGVGTFL